MGLGCGAVQTEADGIQPLLNFGLQEEGQNIVREPAAVGNQGEIKAPPGNEPQQVSQVRVEGDFTAGEADLFESQGLSLREDLVHGHQGKNTGGVRLVA